MRGHLETARHVPSPQTGKEKCSSSVTQCLKGTLSQPRRPHVHDKGARARAARPTVPAGQRCAQVWRVIRGGARPWCPARPGPFGCFSRSHAIALLLGSQGSGASALPREMAKEAEPSAQRLLLRCLHPGVRPKQNCLLSDHEGRFEVGELCGHSALGRGAWRAFLLHCPL